MLPHQLGGWLVCFGWQAARCCSGPSLLAILSPSLPLVPTLFPSAVEKAVHSMFDYLERTTCIPYPASAEPAKPAAPAAPAAAVPPSAALVRPVSPKLLLSFGVAQVSLLWLVSLGAAGLQR